MCGDLQIAPTEAPGLSMKTNALKLRRLTNRYLAWKGGFEALVGKGDNPGILKSPGERPAKVPLRVGAFAARRTLFACSLRGGSCGSASFQAAR